MKTQMSRFLSRFRLDQSLRATAYEGIDNSGPSAASAGAASSMSQDGVVDVHHSSAITFAIREQPGTDFDECHFLGVLRTGLEKEVQESGGKIIASEPFRADEFEIEYKEGQVEGRIRISLSRRGKYYTLAADARERA